MVGKGYKAAAVAALAAAAQAQDYCPAATSGAGAVSQVIITTNVVYNPIVINEYFNENTVINVGGITININNAPTSVSTTITATSTVTVTSTITPTITPGTTDILLAVAAAGLEKHQTGGTQYVASGGTTTTDCSAASRFSLQNGELLTSAGTVSTENGTAYAPFAPGTGSIMTTFAVNGDVLSWTNAAFTNGVATFYLDPIGVVESVFIEPPPTGFTQISLIAVPAAACQSGSNSSTTAAPTTSTTASASTDGTTTTTASATATATEGIILAANAANSKRQLNGGSFLALDGTLVSACGSAAQFMVEPDGSLEELTTGYFVSVDASAAYEPFVAEATNGSITTGFSTFTGTLTFSNSAFTNGEASFCLSASLGLVEIVLTTGPSDCTALTFAPIPVSFCTGNSTSSSTSSSATTTPPTTASSSSTSSASSSTATGNITTAGAGSFARRSRFEARKWQ